jgi:hypothetical protein
MTGRASAFGLALAFVLAVAACGGGVASAKSAYRKGRLAEAKTELLALEEDSKGWSGQRRADYALVRGLVHHGLGDRGAASLWLREAKAYEDAHPGTFDEDDRTRLRLALESLSEAAP